MPIVVEGARTHNLRNLSCTIPHRALTVITGVSGSGKSSLAFDTLYAEGQRRFVESLSTYARQFLERMERPDVDRITGLPPALAIEQRNGVRNARSTVGTVTEIDDYLRLLFANVGEVFCPGCGGRVLKDTAQAAADAVLRQAPGARIQIVAPVPVTTDAGRVLDGLGRSGHRRLLLEGEVKQLDQVDAETARALRQLPVLIDRLRAEDAERARIADSLQQAFALSQGTATVLIESRPEPLRFAEGLACARCATTLRPPTPALFSSTSPLGACPACQGFGRAVGIDYDKVVPDGKKSIAEGAIAPFTMPSNADCQAELLAACKRDKRARANVPWRDLTDAERRWIIDGEAEFNWAKDSASRWYGLRRFFGYLEGKKYKMHIRVMLARFRGYTTCPACEGERLRPEARAVRVDGKTLPAVQALPVTELLAWLRGLATRLGPQARATAKHLLDELDTRVGYLDEVGLGYLHLARQARTLSGGEAQRIALASALGQKLTGTLYVLDEPSVGLHPRDTQRLLGVLRRLVERGNTVVVVEHDPEIMAAADYILDLGPKAGLLGGQLVFAGTYKQLLRDRKSVTGQHLRARQTGLEPLGAKRPPSDGVVTIEGARANNLKAIDASFPVGRMTCLTGVSGSGKSSLLVDVLYANALRDRGKPVDHVGPCDRIVGLDQFDEVVLVDQSPPTRSSRSNPATYLHAMDELRKRFAWTKQAKRLVLGAGAFSFNVSEEKGGGRCENCGGQGVVTLDMQFLADVTVVCDRCDGRRFSERVLSVRYDDRNILDYLNMTCADAAQLFYNHDDYRVMDKLQPFVDVGLGYLKLGQPTSTLSGGELQRLKLASYLAEFPRPGEKAKARLFLLDEPTTGLHGRDIDVLCQALGQLIERGHTVVVIEHNLDFIRRADWIIELGPEAAADGGRVVATGTPAELARARTHTGRALAAIVPRTTPSSPIENVAAR